MKRMTMCFMAIGFVATLTATPVSAQKMEIKEWCKIRNKCTESDLMDAKIYFRNKRIELMERSIAICQNYLDRGLSIAAVLCVRDHLVRFPPAR